MAELERITLGDIENIRTHFRRTSRSAKSLEQFGQQVVSYLYDELRDSEGRSALALVRFFKTHPYDELPAGLRSFADAAMPGVERPPWLKCLTLIATTGDQPEWRSRHLSRGHQAIPLVSEKVVRKAPMIGRLIQQFGLSIAAIVEPSTAPMSIDTETTFGVFHVEEADASPYIPAQDEFVRPAGIRSVIGFGGLLQAAELWSVIMFSKVHVSARTAEQFKPLASALTVAMIPFGKTTFAPGQESAR